MQPGTIIFLEFVAVAGVVLGFGVWQLVGLRRLRRDRDQSGAPPSDRGEA